MGVNFLIKIFLLSSLTFSSHIFGVVSGQDFRLEEILARTTSSPNSERKLDNDGVTLASLTLQQLLNTSVDENAILPWDKPSSDLEEWQAPLEMQRQYPYYLSGYDEEGRPIWIAEVGKWNFRKSVEAGGDTIKNLSKYMEQGAYRVIKARGDKSTLEAPVVDSILIGDLDQFDLYQVTHIPTVSFLLNWASKYRKAITGHLHVCLVLNTNSLAATMVNILKPAFGGIVEKAEIYGTNRANWVHKVLKYCPKDQIPPWYGGSKNFSPVRVYG